MCCSSDSKIIAAAHFFIFEFNKQINEYGLTEKQGRRVIYFSLIQR